MDNYKYEIIVQVSAVDKEISINDMRILTDISDKQQLVFLTKAFTEKYIESFVIAEPEKYSGVVFDCECVVNEPDSPDQLLNHFSFRIDMNVSNQHQTVQQRLQEQE
jgi:hypothetical protein